MKILFSHLQNFLTKNVDINKVSKALFALGHENEINGHILDIDFTPNKGDCLSVYSLARGLKTIHDVSLNIDLYEDHIDEFKFRCSIGKKGSSKNKIEGDNKTPKGIYKIENLYFRKDRIDKPETSLKCIEIKHTMGWCNDVRYPKKYNRLIKIDKKLY